MPPGKVKLIDGSRASGRGWGVAGVGNTLLQITATIEHGTPEQIDACLPVALHLESMQKKGKVIDDASVDAALQLHPALRRNHVNAAYLPNMVQKLVSTCFASHRPGNRAIDPIGHVLNKAWPMRCSVRNFSEIVSAYILVEPDIYNFVLMSLHACMAGAYPGATVHATTAVKLVLYRHYVYDPISPEHLAAWVERNNHILLFVAIKEYIGYAVSTVPGLSSVLDPEYKWEEFISSVTHQADTIRTTLNLHSASPKTMFDSAQTAVQPIRSYKCRTPPLDQGTMCENIQTAVRMAYHPCEDVYHRPLRMPMYYAVRYAVWAGAPVYDIARAVGVVHENAMRIAKAGSSRSTPADWRAVRSIQCKTANDALVLHEFVQAWTMCYKIITHRLPQHIVHEQAEKATRSEYVVYACACCRQLRAFVVDTSTNNNAWACGHQKVLLDDVTGELYCGKRIEKNTVPGRSNGRDSCRSYWKAQQSLMCGYSPLMKIDMAGTLLSFYGKLYMLCPCCMCVMRLSAERFYGATVRCVNCFYRASAATAPKCFHCYKSTAELTTVALMQSTVHVCLRCTRRWMARDDITRSIDIDTAHQAINERWSTNRVAVFCAGI